MNITVVKRQTPILTAGIMKADLFSADSLWAYHPVVVKYKDGYAMLYTGKRLGIGIAHHTLLATSNDLLLWDKKGEVLKKGTGDAWDSDFTAHGFIYKERHGYAMLYDGSKEGDWLEEIGLAESADMVTWKKHPKNPVFTVDRDSWWEWRHVSRCCIFSHKGFTYLFYAGHDGTRERIGVARGKTLTSLERFQKEPILTVGKKGAWDEKSISDPRVISWKDRFLMFYSGIDRYGIERIGVAISKDLVTWRKYTDNPVLDISKDGWDKVSASRADIRSYDNKLHIFYSGKRNYIYSIGYGEIHIKD